MVKMDECVWVKNKSSWVDPISLAFNVPRLLIGFILTIEKPQKRTVKIKELRNEVCVNGAAVALPIEAVETVNARFTNTLYGYFIGDRLSFPLVENYVKNTWAKYGLKRIQLHKEFFLFQFNTREGMESVLENGPWLVRRVPLIFNEWTPNTILKKDEIKRVPIWVKMHHVPIGRSAYARVLIEIVADVELVKSLVVAIPFANKGHTFATIDIEYEWTPPRCATCCIFDHVSEKCPKLPKKVPATKADDEGFIEVKKEEASKQKVSNDVSKVSTDSNPLKNLNEISKVTTKNSFSALSEEDYAWDDTTRVTSGSELHIVNDNDSEDVDEYITMEEGTNSNIRGMNLSPKQTEVRQVIYENKLSAYAILESHVADRNLQRLCKHVFSHWNWVSNAMSCSKGTRIIVGWNQHDVDVNVIHQDSQVIHTRVWIKTDKKEFFCSFVYAHNHYTKRRPLWNGLCLHKNYINNRPWCLLGDFNPSLYVDDTSIGASTLDITMRGFKECVDTMEVMDVQRTGLQFTWNQKPKGKDGILRKLDRVLANIKFHDYFLGAHAVFKPYRISDHSPSVLSIPSLVKVKPKPFNLFNVVLHDERFKEVVRKGCGNLHANVVRLHEELDKVQTDLDGDPSNLSIREKEAAMVVAFNEALIVEEKFLKQKAKITWLKEGDSNTAYFHKAVKSRVSRSTIDVVTDANGAVFQNNDVAKAFINHYEVFLGQPGNTSEFHTDNLFPTRLNENEALNMMFSMGGDKSPGPDGFTAAFFKDTWDIIGADVTHAVCEFFTNGRLLKELNCKTHTKNTINLKFSFTKGRYINHTIIALIPKMNAPARVNDYRPISCCNVLFKCISKFIANRLKDSLKRLVSPNEPAFVPGHCISDNILLTEEIMHNYHLDRGVPRCAFKVDIQKAYDTVDWEFLRVVLIGFGLHERMIAWIIECVTTTSFSISINGSLHGYFKGKRGLRQCDPLSPYLFTLIMEQRLLKEALDEFKDASGLNPSMPKSKAYFCKVINYTKLAILNVLPFEEERLPVKYLGVPLVSSRLIFRDCKELIEKVHNRVNDWKNKSLSIAGRLQLIQSVLGSLHVYWASVFMIPTRVLLDIKQIMRGFLWCQGSMSRGKAKFTWEVVCLPKQEGGLGVRRLDHFNRALSLKESLWVKWIHVYKLNNRSFWDIPYRCTMSWSWRKLLLLRPLIWEFIWTCIGDGNSASMWFDKWCAASPLYNTISSRYIARAGFTHASKVCDCIQDGLWKWPNDWLVKYPILNSIPVPIISHDKPDYLEWRNIDGIGKQFSVHNVWESICPRDNLVPWYDLVWFHACIPRHAFNMWLIFKQRLRTQDCLRIWEVVDGLAVGVLVLLASITSGLMPIAKRKSSKSCIGKLVLAAAAYFVWQELHNSDSNVNEAS
uniref:Reverse transcriptase domain-containing protein n=1 Tax=Tanacetum cinerariifolium TaxID=118510 RepID=A0A6L2KJT8_TANCI|nr:hypothetical protein [Tanacetum cinerariifolium]